VNSPWPILGTFLRSIAVGERDRNAARPQNAFPCPRNETHLWTVTRESAPRLAPPIPAQTSGASMVIAMRSVSPRARTVGPRNPTPWAVASCSWTPLMPGHPARPRAGRQWAIVSKRPGRRHYDRPYADGICHRTARRQNALSGGTRPLLPSAVAKPPCRRRGTCGRYHPGCVSASRSAAART
jgi:hypothetical protein